MPRVMWRVRSTSRSPGDSPATSTGARPRDAGEGVVVRTVVPEVLHVAGGGDGHVAAVEAPDEGEGHIDPGGDTRGGDGVDAVNPGSLAPPAERGRAGV